MTIVPTHSSGPSNESNESNEKPFTPVEGVKAESHHLRGTLAAELADGRGDMSANAGHLLKFHGLYAGDNRDERKARTRAKQELDHIYMVRASIPGGALTAGQWLDLDRVADEVADGTLRLTTRQGVQFHFVRKLGLHPLLRAINKTLLTTLAACGDVVRNVMSCPAPIDDHRQDELLPLALEINARFKPHTRAYYEIWIDGEKAVSAEAPVDIEPVYGDTYLPRKFKIAIAWPGDNCVDLYANDIGIVAAQHPQHGPGFVVVVGGGLGMSHAQEDTFARLAEPLCWTSRERIGDVCEAVIIAFRELGDRTDRKRARLKYVIAKIGIDAFRAEVESHYGGRLLAPVAVAAWHGHHDHLGASLQPNGKWTYGISVPSGRVRDGIRVALREVVEQWQPNIRITADQNVLLTDLAPEAIAAIEATLRLHGVAVASELSQLRRHALACPALPTCSQALAEAERVAPDVLDAIEPELIRRGLVQRQPVLRITGCPNGCARPTTAEIGIVGRTKSTYDLLIGGSADGTRLATTVAIGVKLVNVPELLNPLFDRWKGEGTADETFGDFVHRSGLTVEAVKTARAGAET